MKISYHILKGGTNMKWYVYGKDLRFYMISEFGKTMSVPKTELYEYQKTHPEDTFTYVGERMPLEVQHVY